MQLKPSRGQLVVLPALTALCGSAAGSNLDSRTRLCAVGRLTYRAQPPCQVPNTFFNNGGSYPAKTLLSLIAMLFLFTCIFDIAFIFINYYTTQVGAGLTDAGWRSGHAQPRGTSHLLTPLHIWSTISRCNMYKMFEGRSSGTV
jgi:hypothetical protein